MNNLAALKVLKDQQDANSRAIAGLLEYEDQVTVKNRYRSADASSLMASVKADATAAGADISEWNGSRASVEIETP